MSRNPEGRGTIPRLGCHRSSLISIEHAELLCSTPSLVPCCVWLVTMALHVHCGLGQLSPLPTSGDDKWVAAKHCGRAKWSRISDTHRLRSSLQFRYINNQSLLFTFLPIADSHTPASGRNNQRILNHIYFYYFQTSGGRGLSLLLYFVPTEIVVK